MNKLQKLIASSCATYDRDGKCLLERGANGDRTCVYFRDHGGRCSYAENCVIPGDAKIESLYWAERGITLSGDYCEMCKTPYERKSNRQKYCEGCSAEVRKKKQRQYMQSKRAQA